MSSVKIYAASAGTGKTFTLVREYLKILFKEALEQNYYAYQQVLAITFTIKATEELKSRIVDYLRKIALSEKNDMEDAIVAALPPGTALQPTARKILQYILRDYSNFNIQTIDSLFQDMIRSFAREMDLKLNYEIELDPQSGKEYAVKELIGRVGIEKQISSWLQNYAISRIDSDKGWNFKAQLESFSKELFQEDINLEALEANGERMKDVLAELNKKVKSVLGQAVVLAEAIKTEIETSSIPASAFRKAVFDNLDRIISEYTKMSTPKLFEHSATFYKWLNGEEELITKPKKNDIRIAYDQWISGNVQTCLNDLNQLLTERAPIANAATEALKNIYALGVLHQLNKYLKQYKATRNIMYLSDGLRIIKKFITTAEIPFLFEKIGHQIRYLFIDEFQDTSRQQWNNMLPLLRNILSTTENEMAVLLVGDAKQSIYRWRGGDANIITRQAREDLETFGVTTEDMPVNWRSGEHIISFNNKFFQSCVQVAENLGSATVRQYTRDIYAQLDQKCKPDMHGIGQVTVDFMEKPESDDEEDWKSRAMDQMLEYIETARAKGYRPGDIAILIRAKKDGYLISRFLQDNGYDVVSNGSLLIDADDEVRLLMAAMAYINQPGEGLLYTNLIWQLQKSHVPEACQAGDLLSDFREKELLETLLPELAAQTEILQEASSYEAFLKLADILNLTIASNSYLTSLQQLLYDFYRKESPHLADFLEYWDQEKENKSIQSSADTQKIRLLTLHNSKGLEFPIVLLPLCEWDFNHKMSDDLKWLTHPEIANDAQLPYRMVADLESSIFRDEFEEEKHQRWIDSLNMLYVGFTRAIFGLHIISLKHELPKKTPTWLLPKKTSQLLYEIFQSWQIDELHYEVGTLPKAAISDEQATAISDLKADESMHIPYALKKIFESRETRIGELVHQAFYYPDADRKQALKKAQFDLGARQEEVDRAIDHLEKVLDNSAYAELANRAIRSWSEQQLIYQGEIIRPDKIFELEDSVYVIDYKTGSEEYDHLKQIKTYSAAIADLFPDKKTHACIVYTDSGAMEEVE